MRDVRDSEELGVSSSRKPSLTASGTLTLTLFPLSCSCLVTGLSAPLPSEGRASHHCVPSTAQHMPGYTAGAQKMPWSSPGRLAFSTSLLPLCLCLFLTQPSLFHPILKGSSGEDAHPLSSYPQRPIWGGFPAPATSDGLQTQGEGSEVVRSNTSRAGFGLGQRQGGSEETQLPRFECSSMEDGRGAGQHVEPAKAQRCFPIIIITSLPVSDSLRARCWANF